MKALLQLAVASALVASGGTSAAQQKTVGLRLPAWTPGELDIYAINTGRGDAQFFIFPDGTTMLEDASGGTKVGPAPFLIPSKPNGSRPPAEWVARFIKQVAPRDNQKIDYAVLSHFHGDHMGIIVPDSPLSKNRAYQLSGITEVPEFVPIAKIVDRGWPNYNYPVTIENATMANYRKFLDWQTAHNGLRVEQFKPGHNDQLTMLRDPKRFPEFEVRNIAANGVVWTGKGSASRNTVPPLTSLKRSDSPLENNLSLVFRISYGPFDYYTGGDLSSKPGETEFEPAAWKDIESAVGQATGPVDVMKANHHASWDANSSGLLSRLRPRVILVTARADGHPAQNTYERMTSKRIWPGDRDIFITNLSPSTRATTYDSKHAKSAQGHVVVRVAPGGASYRVFVLEDGDESLRVKAEFGPYPSR
ncbi:MAG: metallohydrolase [Sphingomonas sp.]|uniref:ComEC/Rec2 family competence protein n=1 Tax=Sphingomonas sp. TaxID=28214 RepID=UPI0026186FB0|nr:metallohydrolase [Sphingomonas sp.]MDK2769892.1 metallohydrolase [Sphingomonas sp.]